MPLPDLRTAIDEIWPDIAKARNSGLMWITSILAFGTVVTAIMAFNGSPIAIPLAATAIAISIAVVRYFKHIQNCTQSLTDRVMTIAGFEKSDLRFDVDTLHSVGVLPSGTNVQHLDGSRTTIGSFCIERVETKCIDPNNGDTDSQGILFAGYILIMTGLPAQSPMLLLTEDNWLGFKRLRKFMRAHPDAAMRHEKREEATWLGKVSVFGDDAWLDATSLSAEAKSHLELAARIQKMACDDSETVQTLHVGKDICAVAIATETSVLKNGGLILSKDQLTAYVDEALHRLQRTRLLAELLIKHAETSSQVSTAPAAS